MTQQAGNKRRGFWLLAYALLMLFVGTTIPTPLYRVYQQELHFSSGMLTLVFAVYVFALLPSLLICGRISDQVGRRPVLLVGFCLAACGAVVFSSAHGLGGLFAARALQGISTGVTTGTATAALAELEPARDTARAALVASLANVGGAALGPVFGGILAQYAPWPLALPYVAYLVLLSPVFGLVRMTETVATRGTLSFRLSRPKVPRAIRGAFAFASLVSFTVWAATALFLTLAPSYVAALLHLGNLAVGGSVVFLMLGCSALAQAKLRRLPFRAAVVTGLTLLPAGLAGIVLAVSLDAAWLLFAGTVLAGAGQGLAYLGSLAFLNRIAPDEQRGEVSSSFFVVTYVGVALPALGVGFGAQAVGLFPAVAAFAAIVGVLSLGLAGAAWRWSW